MKLKKTKRLQKLNIACWNMRSLVEDDGSPETGRTRQDQCALKGTVERKLVLMFWELKRYTDLLSQQWPGCETAQEKWQTLANSVSNVAKTSALCNS